ncbi:unnamed protein product [Sphagnum troendelagicum]|uniref:PRISE-like Rossmann-fold domain-containing protein n=1 Tax=Sphagnum troendelagicum TaxID=128251 RepID=A0ABP0TRJ6_9BRYO
MSDSCCVALIAGVTGIVGNSLAAQLHDPNAPGGPWKVYGVARRATKPDWLPEPLLYINCNLLDRDETLSKLSPLHDVTHLFYVTWVSRPTEEENCEANGALYHNVLDAIIPNAKNFQHIVLQTGNKHYIGPFELAGKIPVPDPPFREDYPRRPCPNFYHTLEDITFETVKQRQQQLTYSIHRPTAIFGFAEGNLMNMVSTLAVYAAICQYENKPLIFPGSKMCWDFMQDASDADLVAEQEIWAASVADPKAKNEAFNSTNGDVFKWKRLWQLLAQEYNVQPEYKGEPFSLQEAMKGKDAVWDKIVKEKGLRPGLKLEDVAHWWFVDLWLGQNIENVSSMNKSRERGFLGWRESEKSFLSVIHKSRKHKVVP